MCSGLPSSPPNITTVTPLNDTSFTVNWTISDPNYSYTVICTNLNTNVMTNFTVPENTNSYTVTGLITGLMTGLSDNDNYIVQVAAVNMCGNMISDSKPVTSEHVYVYVYMYVCGYICICYVDRNYNVILYVLYI